MERKKIRRFCKKFINGEISDYEGKITIRHNNMYYKMQLVATRAGEGLKPDHIIINKRCKNKEIYRALKNYANPDKLIVAKNENEMLKEKHGFELDDGNIDGVFS